MENWQEHERAWLREEVARLYARIEELKIENSRLREAEGRLLFALRRSNDEIAVLRHGAARCAE